MSGDIRSSVSLPGPKQKPPTPEQLAKWHYLQSCANKDQYLPLIRYQADLLRQLVGADDKRFCQLAMTMARDCIRYESDIARTGREDLAPPDDAWKRGVDDCDAKARIFVALCRAGGLVSNLVPRWKEQPDGSYLKHLSGEVMLGGAFTPAELTLARARLGELPEAVPVESTTGDWLR